MEDLKETFEIEGQNDMEVLEFSLSDEKIDDLIKRLQELRENKTHIHFNADKNIQLLIHHEGDVA